MLLDNLNTIGGIIITSTSENGEKIIKQEISSISEELSKLFDGKLIIHFRIELYRYHWKTKNTTYPPYVLFYTILM